MTPSAFLELRGVAQAYAGQPVLRGVNLRVEQGEFISLLGPSGCGKTTLLHLIAGFLEPDEGDLLLGGASLRHVPSHRRGVAMVFQNYALFPHMSVFDNVAFGLRMQRRQGAEIRQRVAQALELAQLPGYADRYPDALSGGQRQRVALARALILEPRLLLLDEPLSNLDARLRQSLRDEFLRIHRLTGMTTVLVTHDLEEAFAASDRVAVMAQGAIQQFDTPEAIYRRPATAFVADYLGHGNRVRGERVQAEHSAQTAIILPGGQRIQAPAATHGGRQLAYAIPEHALRVGDAAHAADNRHPARLGALTYLGASVRFELEWGDQILRGAQAPGAWLDGLAVGQDVLVGWDAQDMVALPEEAR